MARSRPTATDGMRPQTGCFRLERLPGGACTHWKTPPCHGAHPEQPLVVRGEEDPVRRQQFPGNVEKDPLALFRPPWHRDFERDLAGPAENTVEPAIAFVEKGCDVPADLDQRRQRARAHCRI